jgi:hypothetical protein
MVEFRELFDHSTDEVRYRFVLSRLSPTAERELLIERLTEFLRDAKVNPSVTADLTRALGWTVAAAPLRAGRVSVRRGDFGEMLAAQAAISIDGQVVPVAKLRYQIDPNQTLPGCDLVAFELDDNGDITNIEFSEVKYRSVPTSAIAVIAHDQLAADARKQFATIISFIAHRLKESNRPLYDAFIRYLEHQGTTESSHAIVLSIDSKGWQTAIADELEEVADLLNGLWLRSIECPEAQSLIDEVYARLGWEPTEDEE